MTSIPLGPFSNEPGYYAATAADSGDRIARFREEFVATDESLIYLDGNSLGRLPAATVKQVDRVVSIEWGENLIASWGDRWWTLGRDTGNLLAPLLGAAPDSVTVADSTSVGLFKLAWAALRALPTRNHIVTDDLNFPTDIYVLDSAGEAAGGRDLEVVPATDRISAPEDAIIAAMTDDTALVSLSHVSFKSGYLYDMERITRAAHEVGAMVLWDLSHSAGVVPIDLRAVDLAVGCTYKYLNGGPGSPAYLYVNPALDVENPLSGWWGHRDPFSFSTEYTPAGSIARFQTGTMPILSLSAIQPAVEMIATAGVDAIREKSISLTGYLIDLADRVLEPLGFSVASPRDSRRRGAHVSLRHDDAWRITQAMVHEARVVPDFRAPDNIRLGLAPLYTRHVDVHTAVNRIAYLVSAGIHTSYPAKKATVT